MLIGKSINSKLALAVTGMSLSYFLFSLTSDAQTPPGISGQYSCIQNKNFGGFDARKHGSESTTTSYLTYIDFTNQTWQVSTVQINGYDLATADTSRIVASGTFSTSNGPIINSYKVSYSGTVTYSDDPQTPVATVVSGDNYYSPVNEGRTLLIQGVRSFEGEAPETGVCNKI